MEAFEYKGTCSKCGKNKYIVSRKEPFCLECHIQIVVPIPMCRIPKEGAGRHGRKGHPHRSRKPRKLPSSIREDADVHYWEADSNWPTEVNNGDG